MYLSSDMKRLDDTNYEKHLTKIFENGVHGTPTYVFYGSPSCEACKKTMENVRTFVMKMQGNSISMFHYVNMLESSMPEKMHYEIHQLNEYPKTVVYFGNFSNTQFLEGVVTVEKMKEIENLAKKS